MTKTRGLQPLHLGPAQSRRKKFDGHSRDAHVGKADLPLTQEFLGAIGYFVLPVYSLDHDRCRIDGNGDWRGSAPSSLLSIST